MLVLFMVLHHVSSDRIELGITINHNVAGRAAAPALAKYSFLARAISTIQTCGRVPSGDTANINACARGGWGLINNASSPRRGFVLDTYIYTPWIGSVL